MKHKSLSHVHEKKIRRKRAERKKRALSIVEKFENPFSHAHMSEMMKEPR
jgi:hypothetical protein